MNTLLSVRVGPIGFRVGSTWPSLRRPLEKLYAGYPAPDTAADYTVHLYPARPWRQWIRPSLVIGGDYMLPEALPLPLAQGLLAAEMAMNLQLALGERRYLLLHAASVERDGRALILTGESGSGKSTLVALLGENGWRFMGDEFVLIEPATGLAHPFPRPISLKNESIAALRAVIAPERWGAAITGSPKGTVRHVCPNDEAIARMDETASPALIVFPRFGAAADVRPVMPSETFVRLTQASTNYVAMGERGFVALSGLVEGVPAVAIDFPDAATALRQVGELWSHL